MREITINKGIKKTKVVMYDDIDQLPIERFNKANKYWMLHDNIGSSFADIDHTHISKLVLLADNKEKLLKELENLRILIYNILSEVNPSHMAFVPLVHSINGEEVTDLSEEGIRRTLKELSDIGLTEGEFKKKIYETREKIYGELEVYFPEQFHNVLSTAYWTKMKDRNMKILRAIIEGKNPNDDVMDAEKYFASLISPKRFSGRENEELRYDKGFEKNCIILSSLTNQPVKDLTTKEYFALIAHYNDSLKNGRRQSNPQGRHN